jgi:hypothetical protein
MEIQKLKLNKQSTVIIIGAILMFGYFSLASFTNPSNKTIENRTIEVIGTAEMALKPDKIQLNIQLYFNNDSRKIKEAKLFKILKKHGIKEEDIIYSNNYGNHRGYYSLWYRYYYEYWYYGYNNNYARTYSIPVTAKMSPKDIMSDLTKPLIYNLWIGNSEFTDATTYRKQVKIEAIKAAKEKAKYLLEALGEQISYVVSIEELNPNNQTQRTWDSYWGNSYHNLGSNLSSNTSNSVVTSNQNSDNTVKGAASDKLKYGVKVIFAIK